MTDTKWKHISEAAVWITLILSMSTCTVLRDRRPIQYQVIKAELTGIDTSDLKEGKVYLNLHDGSLTSD